MFTECDSRRGSSEQREPVGQAAKPAAVCGAERLAARSLERAGRVIPVGVGANAEQAVEGAPDESQAIRRRPGAAGTQAIMSR